MVNMTNKTKRTKAKNLLIAFVILSIVSFFYFYQNFVPKQQPSKFVSFCLEWSATNYTIPLGKEPFELCKSEIDNLKVKLKLNFNITDCKRIRDVCKEVVKTVKK
jgi:hypothetical protein